MFSYTLFNHFDNTASVGPKRLYMEIENCRSYRDICGQCLFPLLTCKVFSVSIDSKIRPRGSIIGRMRIGFWGEGVNAMH